MSALNTLHVPKPSFVSREYHDASMGHKNNHGHECPDHDGLWICDECNEFKTCRCFRDKPFACAPLGTATDSLHESQMLLFSN